MFAALETFAQRSTARLRAVQESARGPNETAGGHVLREGSGLGGSGPEGGAEGGAEGGEGGGAVAGSGMWRRESWAWEQSSPGNAVAVARQPRSGRARIHVMVELG